MAPKNKKPPDRYGFLSQHGLHKAENKKGVEMGEGLQQPKRAGYS